MEYNFDQLPKTVAELIDGYLNMTIEGKIFACPYYRNGGKKLAHPSLAGKGTPDQIISLLVTTAHTYSFDIANSTTDQIREFMINNEIGVDCSGLTVRLIDEFLKANNKPSITKVIKKPKNLYRRLIFLLRPYSNISARSLSNLDNCDPIELKDIKVGDFIRCKGVPKGEHILFVTRVNTESDTIKSFEYIQSTSKYGNANGIRMGQVIIKDINLPLTKQEWTDKDTDGKNPTLEGIKWKEYDNGIRRLKVLKEI
jgi:hypothetical protein